MMNRLIPDYYLDFKCIGSACRDSCCVGWEIDIDDESSDDYCGVHGEFGERLNRCINHTKPYHFMMEGDRCPFLNTSNLCDIYICLGEEHLCQICTDHPRFYEIYGGREEAGLGLVCEEAARLILGNKDKVRFIEEGEKQEDKQEDPWLKLLETARDRMILLLQERQRPLKSRMAQILSQVSDLQEDYSIQDMKSMSEHIYTQKTDQADHGQPADLMAWFCDCIELLQSFEILTDQWERILKLAAVKAKENSFIFSDADAVFYEQLMIYFIYRYFLQSFYDYQLLDKIKFALFGCLVVRGLEASVSDQEHLPDREIARLFSKEIEYSEENMEALFEEFLFSGIFDTQTLMNVISLVFNC